MPESILVVDDQAMHRHFARIVLTAAGYCVLEAGDACSAERALAVERPFLALVDLDLPDVRGLEIAPRLRAAARAPLSIVAFSAHAAEHMRAKALAAGFDGYISKPVDSADLVARVAHYIGAAPPHGGGQERKGFNP